RCGSVATTQRRIERSVSGFHFRREYRLCVGLCARGAEDYAGDVAARVARRAPEVLLKCAGAEVARDVSDRDWTALGQDGSRAVDVEHFIRARVGTVGREPDRHGNGRGDADDGNAYRFHAWGGAPVRRRVSLLPRPELRRHRHNFHEAAKLRGAGFLLSLALWTNNGTVLVVVSEKLLPLLHGGCFRDLSRAGTGSVLQARAG